MVIAHLAFLALSLVCVVLADIQGHGWFSGKKETLDERMVSRLHFLVSIGLGGLLLTGGLMYLDRASYLLSQPVFLVKMVFVLALVINGIVIGALSRLAVAKPFRALSQRERYVVLVSGAVSTLSWIGAMGCGLVLSYVS